jgi:hypothetical protein
MIQASSWSWLPPSFDRITAGKHFARFTSMVASVHLTEAQSHAGKPTFFSRDALAILL